MAILKPDKTTTLGGVTVNEYLLTKHNPNKIDMPSVSMEGRIIGVWADAEKSLQITFYSASSAEWAFHRFLKEKQNSSVLTSAE